MDTTGAALVSRRRLIAGGLAGAGTIALASCAPDPLDSVAAADLHVARVEELPVDDPDDDAWGWAPEKQVAMGAQDIALPQRLTPAVSSVKVRALHDGTTIAFRLDWSDAEPNDLTVRVDDFRDACAVMIAPGAGDEALRTMGTSTQPATLLHWKADWQRDVEQGVQDIAAVYPNRSVDVYPPLYESVPGEVTVADYEAAGATAWLPGIHAGNPISSHARTTCVEKVLAHGFGTSATTATQDATGVGARHGDGWRVVIAKPLAPTEDGEHRLAPGGTATCAFAIWSGHDRDAGSRKTPSAGVYRLVLEV